MRKHQNPKFIEAANVSQDRPMLAKLFGVAEHTIRHWITRARKEGLVPTKIIRQKDPLVVAEVKRLHAEDGMGVRSIASKLKVSRVFVGEVLQEEVVLRGRLWTPEMDEVLKRLYPTETSAREIAEKLGLRKDQVIGRAHRMGLSSPYVKAHPNTLSQSEKAKLRRMWDDFGPAEIARQTGRSVRSLHGLAAREGWPKKSYPARRATAERDYETVKAATAARQATRPKKVAKVVAPQEIPDHAKPWLQRMRGECAYPYGERNNIHSCCQPTFRSGVYCEAHAGLCYDFSRQRKSA